MPLYKALPGSKKKTEPDPYALLRPIDRAVFYLIGRWRVVLPILGGGLLLAGLVWFWAEQGARQREAAARRWEQAETLSGAARTEALTALAAAYPRTGAAWQARFELGQQAFAAGDWAGAAAQYEAVLKTDPPALFQNAARRNLATVALRQGDEAAARRQFERLAADPANPDPAGDRARLEKLRKQEGAAP